MERQMTSRVPTTGLPDLHALTDGLAAALRGSAMGGPLAIVRREPAACPGTFPIEILTCRFADGSQRQIVCKYGRDRNGATHGHRGGVALEARVYRHLLASLHLSSPAFYGAFDVAATGDTWLFIEYLDGSRRLDDTPGSAALVGAAEWIGRFHALARAQPMAARTTAVRAYDARYYRGWVERTAALAGHLRRPPPWLAALTGRFEAFVTPLLAAESTVVHGEYYPKNILVRDGIIHPIDWESAAVAAGEIDLASLTERWPAEKVRRCEIDYQRARWPEGAPAAFERTLAAARLYLHFRWLGERVEWTTREKNHWRFDAMQDLAEQLGLI
jgi:Phosphotransferase enzyme family